MGYAAEGDSGFLRTDDTLPRRRRVRLVVLPVLGIVALLLLAVLAQRAIMLGHNRPAAATAIVPAAATLGRSTGTALPPGSSRFVPAALRLFDIPATPPAETRAARLPAALGRPVAAAVAVSLVDASSAGAVTTFGATPEPAPQLPVAGPGASTSGLVVVPLDKNRIVHVRSTAGGRVVADLVGVFTPVTLPAAAGRTVVVTPQRVAHRVTARDGHEGVVDALAPAAIPDRGVGAVLVQVTADFGRNGGTLRLGPTPGRLGPAMRWSRPAAGDKVRQATAFVPLGPGGRFAVSYHGGFVLDVDVIAFVTDGSAPAATIGLFVPAPRPGALSARIRGGTRTALDPGTAVPDAGAALLMVTARGAERGRVGVAEGRRPSRTVLVSPGADVPRSALVPVLDRTGLFVGADHDTTVRVDTVGVYLAH